MQFKSIDNSKDIAGSVSNNNLLKKLTPQKETDESDVEIELMSPVKQNKLLKQIKISTLKTLNLS